MPDSALVSPPRGQPQSRDDLPTYLNGAEVVGAVGGGVVVLVAVVLVVVLVLVVLLMVVVLVGAMIVVLRVCPQHLVALW